MFVGIVNKGREDKLELFFDRKSTLSFLVKEKRRNGRRIENGSREGSDLDKKERKEIRENGMRNLI